MKSELIAGDTLDFETNVPDYPRSEGWTLTYKLIPRSAGDVISFNAGAAETNDDDYRVQVGASTTEDWASGEYSWAAYVAKAGERYTVDQGTVTIKPDPGTVTAYDGRSHARKALESIEAVIEGRATKDQMEYQISGRMLKRTALDDLMKFRNQYRAEVYAEEQGEAAAIGKGSGQVVVRL